MAEEFNDLTFGDETRRNGDYVAFSVDETASAGVSEGDAVALGEDGYLVAAGSDGAETETVGVLYTFQYYEEANGGPTRDYDRDATVKVGGTVKAEVDSNVSAGDMLEADDGTFVAIDSPSGDENYQAYSDAEEQVGGPRNESQHSEPERDGDHFAEVRLR